MPFRLGLNSFLDALDYFNMSLEMRYISMACIGLSYEELWLVQVLLPLFYPAAVGVGIAVAKVLEMLANRDLPPAKQLIRFGWRPRRNFSLKALWDAYVPEALFFLNMYFNTALAKTMEMLHCTGEGGVSYLTASPEITCWDEHHMPYVAICIIALLFYASVVLVFYPWLLFRLLPRIGLNNPKAIRLAGFAYARFKDNVYWWELLEIIFSKVLITLIKIWITSVRARCEYALAAITALCVLNLYFRPFKVFNYNLLENVTVLTEIVVLLCALMVIYRTDVEDVSYLAFDQNSFHEVLCYITLVISLIACGYVLYLDFIKVRCITVT